jgi:hypothetical protein
MLDQDVRTSVAIAEGKQVQSYSMSESVGEQRTVTPLNLSSNPHCVSWLTNACVLCFSDGNVIVPTCPPNWEAKVITGLSSPSVADENHPPSIDVEARRFATPPNSDCSICDGISVTRTVVDETLAMLVWHVIVRKFQEE